MEFCPQEVSIATPVMTPRQDGLVEDKHVEVHQVALVDDKPDCFSQFSLTHTMTKQEAGDQGLPLPSLPRAKRQRVHFASEVTGYHSRFRPDRQHNVRREALLTARSFCDGRLRDKVLREVESLQVT